ncbi:hypothetical protein PG997_011212 [Apiospora hydei]|uniref:C3H1-type domain-containing protein n=1 Tax=Apiospora hydei TaxID=1337664 RepID=A0ABR1VIF6_9PEZI
MGRDRNNRQSSSGGYSGSSTNPNINNQGSSNVFSPRSSSSDWRSRASPSNVNNIFGSSPFGTPAPTGAFAPGATALVATTTAPPPEPAPLPPSRTATASPSLDGEIVQGPQVELNGRQASYLVCPWWSTYDRCGLRGCPFSHNRGPGLLEQPLICPYWARSPGTTGTGCNKNEGDCRFAHYHCAHGQKAPVPKPK